MAYYDLYHNAPGWGSSGFQFVSPPVPTYQPQPTWGGLDYYRAHGGMSDPYVVYIVHRFIYVRLTDIYGTLITLCSQVNL